MKKIFTLLSLSMLIFSNAKGATVNCSNGECKFNYSHNYDYATTNCLQTLSFEEVETEFLYFTILKTGQECKVTESRKEN